MSAIGIRPVATWKSTDAAPTPISDGATELPSALRPWQDEQPRAKIDLPSSIKVVVELDAEMRGAAAELNFELAARLRDEISELKYEIRQMDKADKI